MTLEGARLLELHSSVSVASGMSHVMSQMKPRSFGLGVCIQFNPPQCHQYVVLMSNNNNGYFKVLFLQRAHSPFI